MKILAIGETTMINGEVLAFALYFVLIVGIGVYSALVS